MLPELFEEHEGEDGVRDETDRRRNETLETQTTALKTEQRILKKKKNDAQNITS